MPDAFMQSIARQSYRRQPETMYRRYITKLTLLETAVCFLSVQTSETYSAERRPMSIASSVVQSRKNFLSSADPVCDGC